MNVCLVLHPQSVLDKLWACDHEESLPDAQPHARHDALEESLDAVLLDHHLHHSNHVHLGLALIRSGLGLDPRHLKLSLTTTHHRKCTESAQKLSVRVPEKKKGRGGARGNEREKAMLAKLHSPLHDSLSAHGSASPRVARQPQLPLDGLGPRGEPVRQPSRDLRRPADARSHPHGRAHARRHLLSSLSPCPLWWVARR